MSTTGAPAAEAGVTGQVVVHGIGITYTDGIGSYGTVPPEGGYEVLGVPMGTHLSVFRHHTESPQEMAGILRTRIDRMITAMGSLGETEKTNVQRTIDVYGQFVSQVGGNGDAQL